LEISVPSIIAKPTSDFDKAGASFVPSPVTATTFPKALSPNTKAYLCIGCALARINKFCVSFLKLSIFFIESFLIPSILFLSFFFISLASI
jgi:hypothetical protein